MITVPWNNHDHKITNNNNVFLCFKPVQIFSSTSQMSSSGVENTERLCPCDHLEVLQVWVQPADWMGSWQLPLFWSTLGWSCGWGFLGELGNPRAPPGSDVLPWTHIDISSYLTNTHALNVAFQLQNRNVDLFVNLIIHVHQVCSRRDKLTCAGIWGCRQQTDILRGCVPTAPFPLIPPSPSILPALPRTAPQPPPPQCWTGDGCSCRIPEGPERRLARCWRESPGFGTKEQLHPRSHAAEPEEAWSR